ncbi:DUF4293 domain-containing protein [Marinigracilibium pacificum]|uniref:DUF4293 domain-containing protein n=1 Tax=Marinigracilibium pacificum TaxID=2729599 RepID=A0A848IZ07_9BACT|nr:DUF4293 domain-containing protein [Marinigracilibium pacificum]NMM49763.1 DUF4293 domain-containing protein [Marinigracilibium pacificum]
MIQRIQTIFLLLVAVFMGAYAVMPIWEKVDKENNQAVVMSTFEMKYGDIDPEANGIVFTEVKEQKNIMYVAGIAGLSAAVALMSLFSFKKRLTQLKLNAFNSLLILASLIVPLLLVTDAKNYFNPEYPGTYYVFSLILPAGAVICNILANIFIRKDEKLIKSVDRIR